MNRVHTARIQPGVVVLGMLLLAPTGCGNPTTAPNRPPSLPPILFASSRDGDPCGWNCRTFDIYIMNADGTGPIRLTINPSDDTSPAWSPDRTKIAFASRRDGNTEIYIMNADGSNPTRLTNDPAEDFRPAWSPDGSKIAFVKVRVEPLESFVEIHVMNADGSSVIRLTNNPSSYSSSPAWSPDGSKIAFDGEQLGKLGIYVMNADGSGITQLTSNAWVPTWSPDGSKLGFATERDGNFEVYVMNADGSIPTRITNNPGFDTEPDWGRRR